MDDEAVIEELFFTVLVVADAAADDEDEAAELDFRLVSTAAVATIEASRGFCFGSVKRLNFSKSTSYMTRDLVIASLAPFTFGGA